MGYYRGQQSVMGKSVPPVVQGMTVPGSVGGVNALDSLAMMPPQDCIYTFNLMPVEYGLRLRRGYREWATGVNGDVRTILPYDSNKADTANDRLWAVTENGIYNVTIDGTTAPTQDVAFADQTGPAGYGVYTEWTDDAENHRLYYADGTNGLHQYLESTGLWSVPSFTYDPGGGSAAFPVDDVAFIAAHKLRLWMIKENSSDAWYTDIASIAGDVTKFTFGAKMPNGGDLLGVYTWSLDGGDGLDDYLVAVARGGDVLVYRGSDPAAADWELVGSWFVGEVPRSRRCVIQHGSEMYVLSTFGLTSVRDLLQGAVSEDVRKSPSAKVNQFLRADVAADPTSYTWSLSRYPAEGFIQVLTPKPASTPFVQYCQNVNTQAWGFWRDVPALCADTLNGQYYMGGEGGVVYVYDGVKDGVQLPGGDVGEAVSFETLTSFQAGQGNHAKFKNVGLIRTIGVLEGQANLSAKAVYDYNLSEVLNSVPSVIAAAGSNWDSALWDVATWDSSLRGESVPQGTSGIGRVVAVGLSGSANSRITIAAWDVMYQEGGYL